MYHSTFSSFDSASSPVQEPPLSAASVKALFGGCADFETRRVSFSLSGVALTLCWIDGLVSADAVSESVLRPLTEAVRSLGSGGEQACYERALLGGVYRCSVSERESLSDVSDDLTHGCCCLLFDALGAALSFELRSPMGRAVSEPTLEKSLKGAKDSFVEALRVNTALVRRRICTPQLKTAESSLGRRSRTKVALLYIEGVANPETVEELARRLDGLDVDAVPALGILEEAIADAPLSPLPQVLHTERPDRFAMHLLDGRVGLLVDGLPVGLLLPATLAEFLRVTGDSGMHFAVATVLGALRALALVLALLLPAVFTAIVMYHQEMLPTRLLLSIIEAEQHVPFSTPLEILAMLGAFSLLQEAGLRLPNPIGDTVSIIGALIVGQAAVEAKLVSPISIIVVAVSGIACYTLPSQDLAFAVRLGRLALLAGAMSCGLIGVSAVLAALLLHLCDLDCFGVNCFAPMSEGGRRRALLRWPKRWNKFRDPQLKTPDRRRQT